MASIKNLKKDINHVLGDIIGACYQWKQENVKEDFSKAQEIIDEAIDTLIESDELEEVQVLGEKGYVKKG